jgi:hypothetical protein
MPVPVRTTDYIHRTKGTIAEIVMAGYPIALSAMVDAILHSDLPKGDRIEFIFEEQVAFAYARASAFSYWRKMPEYRTHHGKSRIGKDSSIEKPSTLLQASDYLAYAILQHLINPDSQKAKLSSPILQEFSQVDHRELAKTQADYLLDYFIQHTGSELAPMDRDKKKYLTKRMKERRTS